MLLQRFKHLQPFRAGLCIAVSTFFLPVQPCFHSNSYIPRQTSSLSSSSFLPTATFTGSGIKQVSCNQVCPYKPSDKNQRNGGQDAPHSACRHVAAGLGRFHSAAWQGAEANIENSAHTQQSAQQEQTASTPASDPQNAAAEAFESAAQQPQATSEHNAQDQKVYPEKSWKQQPRPYLGNRTVAFPARCTSAGRRTTTRDIMRALAEFNLEESQIRYGIVCILHPIA